MQKGDKMPNGYVLGVGRTPLNLTEAQIRYAMKNSKSNSGAARFLNISLRTKHLSIQIHSSTVSGVNLFHKIFNLKMQRKFQLWNICLRYALNTTMKC